MKKLLLCVLCLPFLGFSQDNFIDDKSAFSQIKNPPLLNYVLTDAGINTELSEIGSTFFRGKFLIVSNKKRRHTKTTFNESLNKFNNNIYCTDVDKNGNLSFPLQFSTVLDSEFDEGSMTFSNDEKTIYFTNTSENSTNFKLYKAVLDIEIQGYWKDVTELNVTTNDYSVENPYLNKTGNKLYFSSNMPGGFGGYDIYVADVIEDGTLQNIKNLGDKVNTSSDEKYSFVTPKNDYLYFSSKGHNSFGGYDVFRASITNNNYVNTVNLGSGLNTKKDEINYILVNPRQGYVSVNKENDTENYDVYRFEMEQKEQELNIIVLENNSKIKLPNANVVITDEFGNTVKDVKTNSNGEIKLKIEPLTQYTITVNKEGYDPKTTVLNTSNDNALVTEILNLKQKKAEIIDDAIVLENIFFEFNKASIKEESQLSLNKVATVLNENTEMTISINAHTDNKGSDKYNLTLSGKRAKSAYSYLISKGINKNRISYKGYGESQPLHKCTDCSEIEDQQNRRIEFKIIPAIN